MSVNDTYTPLPSHFRDSAVTELDNVDWSELYRDPRYNGSDDFVLPMHSLPFHEHRVTENNQGVCLKTRTRIQINEPIFLVDKYPGVVFLAGDRIQEVYELGPSGQFVLVRNHRFKNIYFIRRRGTASYPDVECAAFYFLNGNDGENGASIEARNRQWWTWCREGPLPEDIVSFNIGCPVGHIKQEGEEFKFTTARHSEYTYTLILQRDAYPSVVVEDHQQFNNIDDQQVSIVPDEGLCSQLNRGIPDDFEFAQDAFARPGMDKRPVDVAKKAIMVDENPYKGMKREASYERLFQHQRDLMNERFIRSNQASNNLDDSSYGSSPSSSATSRSPVKGLIKRNLEGQWTVKWTTEDFEPVVINVIPESRKVHEKNMRYIFGYLAAMNVTGEEISDATALYSGSGDSDTESDHSDDRNTPTPRKNFETTSKANVSSVSESRHGQLAPAPRNQKNHAPPGNSAAEAPPTPTRKLVAPGVTITIQTPTPRSAKMYGYPASPASSSSSSVSGSSSPSNSPTPSSIISPALLTPRHRDRRTNELFKTELCKNYTELGLCKYGESCQFAHGPEELRNVKHHAQWRTKTCAAWLQGGCTYGSRCCYAHEIKGDMSGLFEGNPKLEDRQLLSATPSGLENLDLSDLRPKPSSKIFASVLENDNFTPFMMNLKTDDNETHTRNEETPDNVIPSAMTIGSMSSIAPPEQRPHYPSRFFG